MINLLPIVILTCLFYGVWAIIRDIIILVKKKSVAKRKPAPRKKK